MKPDVNRLRMVVEVLQDVQDNNRPFTMNVWAERDWGSLTSENPEGVSTCGTAACALGWAARDPKFNAMGLRIFGDEPCLYAVDPELIQRYKQNEPDISGYMESGFAAAVLLFNIEYVTAYHLFSPTRYPSGRVVKPRDVIKRLQKIIDDAELMP